MNNSFLNEPEPEQKSFETIQFLAKYAAPLFLILLIVIFAILEPRFLHPLNLLNVLRQVSITGLIAVGMTFVILTAGIDLSVGSRLALSGQPGHCDGPIVAVAPFPAPLSGVKPRRHRPVARWPRPPARGSGAPGPGSLAWSRAGASAGARAGSIEWLPCARVPMASASPSPISSAPSPSIITSPAPPVD